MTMKQQMNIRIKQEKMFNTCKLNGNWKKKRNNSQDFKSQDKGSSSITLTLQGDLVETLSFKKGADISIKGGLLEYYDQDLL